MSYCEQDLASLLENMQTPFSEAQVNQIGRCLEMSKTIVSCLSRDIHDKLVLESVLDAKSNLVSVFLLSLL